MHLPYTYTYVQCTQIHPQKTTTNISPRWVEIFLLGECTRASVKNKADARTARTGNIESKETKIDTQRPGQRRRKLKVCPSIKHVARKRSAPIEGRENGGMGPGGRWKGKRCALNRPRRLKSRGLRFVVCLRADSDNLSNVSAASYRADSLATRRWPP